jgi:hypothetical protein
MKRKRVYTCAQLYALPDEEKARWGILAPEFDGYPPFLECEEQEGFYKRQKKKVKPSQWARARISLLVV